MVRITHLAPSCRHIQMGSLFYCLACEGRTVRVLSIFIAFDYSLFKLAHFDILL